MDAEVKGSEAVLAGGGVGEAAADGTEEAPGLGAGGGGLEALENGLGRAVRGVARLGARRQEGIHGLVVVGRRHSLWVPRLGRQMVRVKIGWRVMARRRKRSVLQLGVGSRKWTGEDEKGVGNDSTDTYILARIHHTNWPVLFPAFFTSACGYFLTQYSAHNTHTHTLPL